MLLWDISSNYNDQVRYGFNEKFIYWKLFKGYNDWMVLSLDTINMVNKIDEIKAYEATLHEIESKTN